MLSFKSFFNLLNEAHESSGNYVDVAWANGGIPDLSGVASVLAPSQEKLLWKTPARNAGSSQLYKAALLDTGELVFFKHPAKFTRENILPKLERYLKDNHNYNRQITKIFQVNPSVINRIGKQTSDMEEYRAAGGERMGERSLKMDGMGEKLARIGAANAGEKYIDNELAGGNRTEIMAKIKEKANALAREKMKVLMSNGVSREDALAAAKEAYKKFVDKFYSESALSTSKSGTRQRADYHPIISKSGDAIKQARKQGAKDAAMNLYRRLRQQGKPDAEAKQAAQDYYNKMTSK
jgi:hypothetical protein